MNGDLPRHAFTFGLYDKNEIIGIIAVLHQPSINKKLKRVCRLVILPDYQGIGLGKKLLDIIAEYYVKQGFDFSIVTSAKNLIYSLKKSSNWVLSRYNVSSTQNIKSLKGTNRKNCKTASFYYKK